MDLPAVDPPSHFPLKLLKIMRAETVYSVLGKVNIIVILTRANLRYMTWEVAIHMTHDRRYAWVTEFSEPRVWNDEPRDDEHHGAMQILQ